MATKKGVIYKITSPTGKIYIGKAVCFSSRMSSYRALRCKDQKALYASLIKHGFENHLIDVIFEGPKEILSEKEKYYIKEYNSYSHNNPNGLNLTLGGDGALGRVYTNEQKEKIKNKHTGSKRSEEARKRMSLAAKGKNKNYSKEALEIRKKRMLGNTFGLGVSKTSESISKFKSSMINTIKNKYGHILQIDLDGNVIKTWEPSYTQIAKEIGCDPSTLRRAVLSNGKRKTSGYNWKFEKK